MLLLLIPSVYGIGIAFGSLVMRFKEPHALVYFVRGVFMIFCGLTFPVAVTVGSVSVTPDPLVSGKTTTYTFTRNFAKAVPTSSAFIVLFANTDNGKLVSVGDFFITDICVKALCSANTIKTVSTKSILTF